MNSFCSDFKGWLCPERSSALGGYSDWKAQVILQESV